MPSGRKHYDITALAYDKRGKLLSVGKNSYIKTHTLQAEYAKRVGRDQAIFLHAEIHALVKAREAVHKLVVLRHDSKGHPANATPCSICQLAIREFGVKEVVHT